MAVSLKQTLVHFQDIAKLNNDEPKKYYVARLTNSRAKAECTYHDHTKQKLNLQHITLFTKLWEVKRKPVAIFPANDNCKKLKGIKKVNITVLHGDAVLSKNKMYLRITFCI